MELKKIFIKEAIPQTMGDLNLHINKEQENSGNLIPKNEGSWEREREGQTLEVTVLKSAPACAHEHVMDTRGNPLPSDSSRTMVAFKIKETKPLKCAKTI